MLKYQLNIFTDKKTGKIYQHPVISNEGEVFERSYFLKKFPKEVYTENKYLKRQIDDFLREYPEYLCNVFKSDPKTNAERLEQILSGSDPKIKSLEKIRKFNLRSLDNRVFRLPENVISYIFSNFFFYEKKDLLFLLKLSLENERRDIFEILLEALKVEEFPSLELYEENNFKELVIAAIKNRGGYINRLEKELENYRFGFVEIFEAINTGFVDIVILVTKKSHYFEFEPRYQKEIFLASLKSGNIGIIENVFRNIFNSCYIFDDPVLEYYILRHNSFRNIVKIIGMMNPNPAHLLSHFEIKIKPKWIKVIEEILESGENFNFEKFFGKPTLKFDTELSKSEIHALYFLIKNI